jgi:hypothetical protein
LRRKSIAGQIQHLNAKVATAQAKIIIRRVAPQSATPYVVSQEVDTQDDDDDRRAVVRDVA